MGRIKQLNQPVGVHLRLPADLVGRIYLLLYSDAHGGVPYGALSQFYEIALREKLERVDALRKEKENGAREPADGGASGPLEAEGNSGHDD
jgi:hypothetical protein